jgi:hypothetical protein
MDHASTYRLGRGDDGGLHMVQTFPDKHTAVFRGFHDEAAAERWLRGRLQLNEEADLGKWLLKAP